METAAKSGLAMEISISRRLSIVVSLSNPQRNRNCKMSPSLLQVCGVEAFGGSRSEIVERLHEIRSATRILANSFDVYGDGSGVRVIFRIVSQGIWSLAEPANAINVWNLCFINIMWDRQAAILV